MSPSISHPECRTLARANNWTEGLPPQASVVMIMKNISQETGREETYKDLQGDMVCSYCFCSCRCRWSWSVGALSRREALAGVAPASCHGVLVDGQI